MDEGFSVHRGRRLRRDLGDRRDGEHSLDQVKKPARVVLVPAIAQLQGIKPRKLAHPG